MSGIAELLANLGYEVSGSDAKAIGRDRSARDSSACACTPGTTPRTSAPPTWSWCRRRSGRTIPKLLEARRRRIPVIPRAEMLAELMRLRYGIAIAGAHGKTTTTSMVALVLERAGLDPTAVIGGRLSAFGSNARLGPGRLHGRRGRRKRPLVPEAVAGDRASITNIDREHMDSLRQLGRRCSDAFVEFANKVPFYGAVVACADDEAVRALLPRITPARDHLRLGGRRGIRASPMSPRTTCTLEAVRLALHRQPRWWTATRETLGAADGSHVPGRHNLLNALAPWRSASSSGCRSTRLPPASRSSAAPSGASRCAASAGGVMVVDDYGHHPTEIAAVIAAARAGIGRRLVVVFQPHRYTRTRDLLRGVRRRAQRRRRGRADRHLRAGEPPIAGVTVDALAAVVRAGGTVSAFTSCRRSTTCRRGRRALRGRAIWSSRWAPARSAASAIGSSARARSGDAQGPSDDGQGAGGEELPPRRGQRPGRGSASVARLSLERGRGACSACCCWCSASITSIAFAVHDAAAPGRPGSSCTATSGCRAARCRRWSRICAAAASCASISTRSGGGCSSRPGSPTSALRRVLPSTVEILVSERRPVGLCRLGAGPVPGRRDRHGDRPVRPAVFASSTCRSSTAWCSPRRTAERPRPSIDVGRAELASRVIAALTRQPADRAAGCRRSTCRDAHDAVVLLDDDPALLHLGDERVPASASSRTWSCRRRCASECRTSTTSICASSNGST